MATSGSIDYAQNRDEIIKEAYELIGAVAVGQNPSNPQIQSATITLNNMVKSWQADRDLLWKIEDKSELMVDGTATYNPTDVIGITNAYLRNSSGFDTPVEIISREDYYRISDKTQEGYPNQLWMVGGLTPEFNVWPVPDSSDTWTLYYAAITEIEDFDAAADNADFPKKWNMCLAFNLAYLLTFKSPVSNLETKKLSSMASTLKRDLENDATEFLGMTISPARNQRQVRRV